MSTKYNTKHPDRNKSRYPHRLRKRGLTKAPTLEGLDALRARQARRIEATCSLPGDHKRHECNGFPWAAGAYLAEEDAA